MVKFLKPLLFLIIVSMWSGGLWAADEAPPATPPDVAASSGRQTLSALAELSPESLQILERAFTGEPPLTQRDIENYIKFAPRLLALEQNAGGGTGQRAQIIREAGVSSPLRAVYISTKIGLAQAAIFSRDPKALAAVPGFLQPTPAEKSLVVQNRQALVNAQVIPLKSGL